MQVLVSLQEYPPAIAHLALRTFSGDKMFSNWENVINMGNKCNNLFSIVWCILCWAWWTGWFDLWTLPAQAAQQPQQSHSFGEYFVYPAQMGFPSKVQTYIPVFGCLAAELFRKGMPQSFNCHPVGNPLYHTVSRAIAAVIYILSADFTHWKCLCLNTS